VGLGAANCGEIRFDFSGFGGIGYDYLMIRSNLGALSVGFMGSLNCNVFAVPVCFPRSNLCDTAFLQVDHRILKAIAIEHRKDVDSAVVAVLDEVMPSMTGSAGALSTHREGLPSMDDSVGNLFANRSTCEVGSSSSAGEYEIQTFSLLHLFFLPMFGPICTLVLALKVLGSLGCFFTYIVYL
jgi:hypothetical protein